MDEVKKAVDVGVSFGAAVKDKLGTTLEAFCKERGLVRPDFSAMLNGREVPTAKQLTALVAQFGGTAEGWLDLWFKTAKKRAVGAAK